MHNQLLLLLLLSFSMVELQVVAQTANCTNASSSAYLESPTLKAAISNTGYLFIDDTGASLFVGTDTSGGNSEAATIYSSSLWFGAQNSQGEIKLVAPTYGWPQGAYVAGPLNPATGQAEQPVCANFNRLWTVSAQEIESHLTDWADNGVIDQPQEAVMAWPARNNPHFEAYNGFPMPYNDIKLAPFFDYNGDGAYNPLDGDYPDIGLAEIPPHQIYWCVYNTSEIGLQIAQTAWIYNCTGNSPLNRSVFLRFDLTYLGATPLTDAYAGFWSDPDLGCYIDDFIGSYPAGNACFIYNADNVDGIACSCQNNIAAFCNQIPVQSIVLLNRPISNFIAFNNPSVGNVPWPLTDPASPLEYYHSLRGFWRDGSPMTFGDNGYQGAGPLTSFLYSGDPRNPNNWSMMQLNSTIQYVDYRTLLNTQLGYISPGQQIQLDYALAFHLHPDPSYWLDHIGAMYEEVDWLRDWYSSTAPTCERPLSVGTFTPLTTSAILFPNPANDKLNILFDNAAQRTLMVFDLNGRLCYSATTDVTNQCEIDCSNWPAGMYLLQINSAGSPPEMLRWLKQ